MREQLIERLGERFPARLCGPGSVQASALAVQILTLSTFTSQAASVDVSRFLPPAEVRAEDAAGTERAPEGGGVRVQPVLGDLAALPASEQARFVRRWGTTLERRQGVLQASVSRPDGRIGDLRARMEEQYAARSRLVARRDAARESYTSLITRLPQQEAVGPAPGARVTVTNAALGARRAGVGGWFPRCSAH